MGWGDLPYGIYPEDPLDNWTSHILRSTEHHGTPLNMSTPHILSYIYIDGVSKSSYMKNYQQIKKLVFSLPRPRGNMTREGGENQWGLMSNSMFVAS